MYEYDDFYEEPTELDERIAEFKAALMKSVKQEFLNKMDRLEKENAELIDFKKRKKEIEQEHQKTLAEMKQSITEAERKIRSTKLRELLGEHFTVGWGIKQIPTRPPKCDKCDKDRRIHFFSPSGNELTEPCACDKATYTFEPEELSLVRFYMHKEKARGEEHISRYYRKANAFDSDYDEYSNWTNIYKAGTPFEKLSCYGIVFLDKDTCQKYCDWLNTKEEQ